MAWEWDGSGWCRCATRTTDTGLLCTPSAVTMSVDVPAPLNSGGTNKWISSSPASLDGATVSTITVFPLIVTETFFARSTPVAKTEIRNLAIRRIKRPRHQRV